MVSLSDGRFFIDLVPQLFGPANLIVKNLLCTNLFCPDHCLCLTLPSSVSLDIIILDSGTVIWTMNLDLDLVNVLQIEL